MPPEAKVYIAEDDPMILGDMKYFLEKAGHEVVATGATLQEARAMIPQISEAEKKYGPGKVVVVLGGSLGLWREPNDPENDSQVILKALKDAELDHVPTIGYSGNSVPGTTVDISKGDGAEKLAETVTRL